MPRPKERNLTVIKCFSIEYSIYTELEARAREHGVSISSLVERIISTYLGNANKIDPQGQRNAQGNVKTDDDIDPLTEIDLQYLYERIGKYERSLENFSIENKKRIDLVNRSNDEATKKYRQESYQNWYNREYNNLYDTWLDLRASFEKLRRKIPKSKAREISKRLAELKKKVDML
jgi:hypothetical protein